MINWVISAILTLSLSAAALRVDLRETLNTSPACKTLYGIRSYTSYMAADDRISAQNLLDKDCRMLEGGVSVYLMERMGRFVQIRIQADGQLVWTVKEAIE